MDEIAESLNQLSTNAKEWKPGMSYTPSTKISRANKPNVTAPTTTSNRYNPPSYTEKSDSSSPNLGSSSGNFLNPIGIGDSGQRVFLPSTNTSTKASSNSHSYQPPISTNNITTGMDNYSGHYHSDSSSNYYRQEQQQQQQHFESSEGKNWRAKEFIPNIAASPAKNTTAMVNGNTASITNESSSTFTSNTTWKQPISQSSSPPLQWSSLDKTDDNNTNWEHETSNPIDFPITSATLPTSSTVPSAPPPSRTTTVAHKNLQSLGLPDAQWSFYRAMAMEALREMEPTDPRHKAVPTYFSHAFPLDVMDTNNTAVAGISSFGYPSSVFKVMNKKDGHLYCLRRLDNVKCVSHRFAAAVLDRWTNATPSSSSSPTHFNTTTPQRPLLDHPGIVRLHQCFVSQRAVFFVHSYHPGAITLHDQFLNTLESAAGPSPRPPSQSLPLLQESLLWSCITQLVSTIQAIHSHNLACRTLTPNHVLCTYDQGERLRLRINCIGVVDALEYESRKHIADLQREDIRSLGRLILSLATRTLIYPNVDVDSLRRYEMFVAQNFSSQFHALVIALVFGGGGHTNRFPPSSSSLSSLPTIYEISSMITSYLLNELDDAHITLDRAQHTLSCEYESGRSLRLLLKLGFINERPEFRMDKRWSETGDCYVLKLFRDYVFHQADVNGQPMMDLGHVVTALNKLDAADPERIVLTSRDGKSLLVVSFADVARCLEGAYNELCAHSNAAVEGRYSGSLAY